MLVRRAGVDSLVTEFFFDAQELVVLGQTLGAARGARLDLTGGQAHGEIGDEGIFGFAGAVGSHDTPASLLGHADGLDGLGDGADLVHLEQEGVAPLAVDGGLHALRVGHQQVVADDLAVVLRRERGGVFSVILVERILDGDHRILADELLVQVDHLGTSLLHGTVVTFGLEVEIVALVFGQEFRRRDVHTDLHLAGVASLFDRFNEEVETFLVVLNVRRETTFVTDVARILAVLLLDDGLQVVVDFGAHLHRLLEGGSADRQDHELLHGELVTGVGTTVDDVESRHREHQLAVTGEVGDVLVERHVLFGGASLGDGHGNREHGVGAELALVVRAIEVLAHEVIDRLLVARILTDERRGDDFVQVLHGLHDALAHVFLAAVAKFHGFVDTRGRTTRHHGAEHTLVRVHIGFNRRVTARVKNLATDDLRDGGRRALFHVLALRAS